MSACAWCGASRDIPAPERCTLPANHTTVPLPSQWSSAYLGGNGASVHLDIHLPCGAFIADSVQHEKVCTAPPWRPIKPEQTIKDWS